MKFLYFALAVNGATLTVYPSKSTTTISTSTTSTTRNLYLQSTTASVSSASSTYQTTAITDCHFHGTTVYCVDGEGNEGVVSGAATVSSEVPTAYTGCHVHDVTATYCIDSDGDEVEFVVETDEEDTDEESAGTNCHYHAGVEHCTTTASTETCERTDRDYNIPLRIGLLFVVLVTSALGVLGPMFINKLFKLSTDSIIFMILKQFGTGVIISTAFVHLITHAELMWSNECLSSLTYEATSSAITMAGIFLAFLVEYIGHRLFGSHHHQSKVENSSDDDKEANIVQVESDVENLGSNNTSVVTMELGIVFHSILIGVTLVVTADSAFITLFIVIVFHQFFEGIALGSRIAELVNTKFLTKLVMGFIFSIITPIGMAIGIGVLSKFNGNDKSTIIALGTLDSFSAGVLIWTGVVEMWAGDWLFGSLAHGNKIKTGLGLLALIIGMLLMSVLGKWA